ncbi:MAG: hypothetical protein HWD58_06165 [Bacteroidota bacterium]|nr:MAG: hypothetical protein HWD58_06165 [Bacteroidota bacterium]
MNGGSYGASNVFSSLAAGSYTISVKDANNCMTSSVVTITAPTPVGGCRYY